MIDYFCKGMKKYKMSCSYAYKKLGFRFYREGRGSHQLWVRDTDGKVIPLPKRKGKDLKKGTLRAIIREIGISPEEFVKI